MTTKTEKLDDKEILENFLHKLIPVLSRNQRALLSDLVEQIIDSFELNYSVDDFTSDRRYTSSSMGRKSGKYFMRNQTTGEYIIGTAKEISNALGCTTAAFYIAFRRSTEKGETYLHKKCQNGVDYRINECKSDEDVELDIHFAEQLQKEYKERLERKRKMPHVNEDGSY